MNNRIALFSYGTDLNLTLLHCMVGGIMPSCRGWALLHHWRRTWNTCGHLPGIEPCPGAVTAGAITVLTRDQLARLESCWMVPSVYQYVGRREVRLAGRRSQWVRVYGTGSPMSQGLASYSGWLETLRGAEARGLPSWAVEEIRQARSEEPLLCR